MTEDAANIFIVAGLGPKKVVPLINGRYARDCPSLVLATLSVCGAPEGAAASSDGMRTLLVCAVRRVTPRGAPRETVVWHKPDAETRRGKVDARLLLCHARPPGSGSAGPGAGLAGHPIGGREGRNGRGGGESELDRRVKPGDDEESETRRGKEPACLIEAEVTTSPLSPRGESTRSHRERGEGEAAKPPRT